MSRRDEVEITRVQKRGEWYTVEGVKAGKKASVDIPAASVDSLPREKAEALMKRGIHGTVAQEKA